MKRIIIGLFAAILFCGSLQLKAQSDDVKLYFSTEELPDLIKCLPPPPAFNSPEFSYDVLRYQWGKTQRLDPERAAIARRDAVWSYEALLAEFNVPFGLTLSKTETPEIWKLLVNSMATTDQMRVAPKAYYHRLRPFEMYEEHLLSTETEAELSGEGSYPSGHTMRGWLAALLLAEINPERSDTLFARGWMYCESRVIEGAHWQSDIDATKVGASIGYAALHTSPEFLAQLGKAQDEFKRLTGAISSTDDYSQFVNLAEAIPDVILEIRYYGTYNFVGARVDGYEEPIALLTRQAADSLRAVSDDLMKQGYRLKIYDTYRPQCAVDHFVRWASNVNDTLMKPYFYPEVPRDSLFELGYIAKRSGHTRGSTVDLTLFDMATEKEVDMGGTFDWFGLESHPDFGGDPETGTYKGNAPITAEQFHNRMILREAMLRHGFKAIDEEWWHFTLKNEPFPDTYFTFPVKRLPN
jgi:D-alanyl-D-alanine dipeptidase